MLEVGSLTLAGVLLALGGLLHAHVPPDPAGQVAMLAASARWEAAHWALTFGQPLAIVGLLAIARRLRNASGQNKILTAGVAAAAAGLLIGTLGTLSSATALKTAAAGGHLPTYLAVSALTLGLGWLSVVLLAVGGALMGAHGVAPGRAEGRHRALAAGILVASLAFLALATLLPPHHPWTHSGLLRYGAILLGAFFVGFALWMAKELERTPSAGRSPASSGARRAREGA